MGANENKPPNNQNQLLKNEKPNTKVILFFNIANFWDNNLIIF